MNSRLLTYIILPFFLYGTAAHADVVKTSRLNSYQSNSYYSGFSSIESFLKKCVRLKYYDGGNNVKKIDISSFEEDSYGYYFLADVTYSLTGIVLGSRIQSFRADITISKERHNRVRCGYIGLSR